MDGKFPPLLAEKRLKDRTKWKARELLSNLQPVFLCGQGPRKARDALRLTTRIYNDRAQQSASEGVSQAVNGCAAQHSRQVLTLRAKTC